MCDRYTGRDMDFITTLEANYAKLRKKDIITVLWREIIKEKRETNLEDFIDYSFHHPVDTETYLEQLNMKFDDLDKEQLRTIDGRLKAYLITFLYYCTKCDDNRVPIKTTALASCLYLKLGLLPGIGEIFFEPGMYKVQLMTCVNIIADDSLRSGLKIYVLKLLKKYCIRQRLDNLLLKGTANTISGIILMSCLEPIRDIRQVTSVPLYAINSIREIIMEEKDGPRLKFICESIFRCLRRCIGENVDHRRAGIDLITLFIKDILRHELAEAKYPFFLEGFCGILEFNDFDCSEDAVIIINLLKPQHYKELIHLLVVRTQSNCNNTLLVNVMNLLYAMAENLPSFSITKVQILYSCAVRNIIYHLVEEDRTVADKVVQFLTKLCVLKNNQLMDEMFDHFECTSKFINISAEALFLSFIRIADEKWGVSPRNYNLLVMFCKFVSYTQAINIDLVQKALRTICKDGTPTTLRPILPMLHELFCVMALKEDYPVAEAVLNIIYMNAMHQDVSSVDYQEHIYQSMLQPSFIDGVAYSQKLYSSIFLSSRFEYEAFFAKYSKSIRERDVFIAINNLDYEEPGSAVLICCLLNHCHYSEIDVLAIYIIRNFGMLASHISVGFVCMAFDKILSNRRVTPMDYNHLNLIQMLILEALLQQSFPVPSIKPAYDLYQTIRKSMELPDDEEKMDYLLRVSSARAFRRLKFREPGDDSVLMYLNEICLLLKRLPTEDVLTILEKYMDTPTTLAVFKMLMPDIYLQLLTLFTTIAMMNKARAPQTLRYLQYSIQNEDKIFRVVAYKLMFSICKEITHEYELLIRYSFKEMVTADPCLTRICSVILEELIHKDYIKLTPENFFRFTYILGCSDLKIFMKNLVMKRFLLSNQNDIARNYVQCIVYLNNCCKLTNYQIAGNFFEDLSKIKLKIDRPTEFLFILFEQLPIRKKFNIISDISAILADLVDGKCRVDDTFFNVLIHFLMTIKFMKPNSSQQQDPNFYGNVVDMIDKQIVHLDPACEAQSYYMEYESEIKFCTVALLKLLFYENEQLAIRIQVTLFDTIMHWIDFVKDEIIHHIHLERSTDYGPYLSKLVQYYKRNKGRIEIVDSQLVGHYYCYTEDSKAKIVLIVPGILYRRALLRAIY